MLLIEGRQQLIKLLETLAEQDPDLEVCINCFEIKDECGCRAPVVWNISHVINKLKLELQ